VAEREDDDWMWRVHHVQCPDPAGRVVFRIERTGNVEPHKTEAVESRSVPQKASSNTHGSSEAGLKRLRITVEEGKGHCTSRMKPGDEFELCSGRLYLPPGGHACLYALHAAIPLLPAKQRLLQDGDWMKEDHQVLCPDPAGNVILRIDQME
ncbi:MAG: TIGR04076 family protein, partial [Gemmatimonadota bacterium]